MNRFRLWLLCGAVVLYGLRSAPAPTGVGKAELAIGAALALAVGLAEPLRLLAVPASPAEPEWRRRGVLCLMWLLLVPGVRGLVVEWSVRDIARDVIPLLFLFSPLVLVPILDRLGEAGRRGLAAALAVAGVLFALRWWHFVHWNTGALGAVALSDGPKYLLNAPAVLFAAIALPALALIPLERGGGKGFGLAGALAVLGAAGLAALAGAVHRFALAVATVALGTLGLRTVLRSTVAAGILGLGVVTAGGVFGWRLWQTLGLAVEKSRQVGVNARWDEAAAVFDQLAASPVTLLLGDGWGTLIANPAVGGWRVSYTHSLFTYILVKGGLLGLAVLAAWLGSLVPPGLRALARRPHLAVAALAPVLMALTVHSSYKYFDTGLLLTLLLLLADNPARTCERAAPAVPASAAPSSGETV